MVYGFWYANALLYHTKTIPKTHEKEPREKNVCNHKKWRYKIRRAAQWQAITTKTFFEFCCFSNEKYTFLFVRVMWNASHSTRRLQNFFHFSSHTVSLRHLNYHSHSAHKNRTHNNNIKCETGNHSKLLSLSFLVCKIKAERVSILIEMSQGDCTITFRLESIFGLTTNQ